MRKKLKAILLAGACAATVACVGVFASIGRVNFVSAEGAAPSVAITSRNLSLKDNICIKFAVQTENVTDANVKLLVWTEAQDEYTYGTQDCEIDYDKNNLKGGEPVFNYTALSARQMTEEIYVCAYVEEDGTAYYSETMKYSILEYAYNKLGKTEATATGDPKLLALLEQMLKYGAAAEYYNDDALTEIPDYINDYTYVRLAEGATFADGFDYGIYKAGTELTVTAKEGYTLIEDAPDCYSVADDGTVTLTVPDEKLIDLTSFVNNGDNVSAEDKVAYEKEMLQPDLTTAKVGDRITLSTQTDTYADVTITWSSETATVENNVLIFTTDGKVSLTATLSCEDVTDTKSFDVIVVASAEISFADKANRTSISTTAQVWEQNGIKFTNRNNKDSNGNATDIADYTNPVRLYANSEVIMECGGMKRIVFICSSASYANALKESIGASATVSGNAVTVVFDTAVNTFTVPSLAAQVRINSITVYFK